MFDFLPFKLKQRSIFGNCKISIGQNSQVMFIELHVNCNLIVFAPTRPVFCQKSQFYFSYLTLSMDSKLRTEDIEHFFIFHNLYFYIHWQKVLYNINNIFFLYLCVWKCPFNHGDIFFLLSQNSSCFVNKS